MQGESISEQIIPVLVRSEDSVGYAISRLVEALKMKYGKRNSKHLTMTQQYCTCLESKYLILSIVDVTIHKKY